MTPKLPNSDTIVGANNALINIAKDFAQSFTCNTASRYLHASDDILIMPPVKGVNLTSRLLKEIKTFRYKRYQEVSPYLNTDEQQKLERELALDDRSAHIIARNPQGKMIGVIRLTDGPFEISHHIQDFDYTPYSEHLEINRLVTDGSIKGTGKRLMLAGGLYAVDNSYQGLIGICRQHKLNLFDRFGMHPLDMVPREISSRNESDYMIIGGDVKSLSMSVLKNLLLKMKLQVQ